MTDVFQTDFRNKMLHVSLNIKKSAIPFWTLLFSLVWFSSCSTLLDSSYGEPGGSVSNNPRSSILNNRMPSEPGKCYAKCLIQDEYETFEEEILVYNGNDFDIEGIELETIVVSPASTKWEKKKNENCKSADPNDCLVWCLKEYPEVSYDFYVVKDTSIVKDYYREVIDIEKQVQTGGYTEWREVICQADVTEELYRNIQMALIEEGFGDNIVPDGKISRSTKEALVAYQKSNGLPVGSLDIETMKFLGVDY